MLPQTKTFTPIFIFITCLFLPTTAAANDSETAKGGRIYDKWWVELNLDAPNDTHPAYPSSAKKKGANTWRCKECHGWDYLGKDGAYSKGSHFTGIKGISAYKNKRINNILPILRDKNHQYQTILNENQLLLIATFVQKGQIDMKSFINYNTKSVQRSSKQGKPVFKKYCINCHGKNGKDINLSHDKSKRVYIGTIANKNPWETLHKIRNGHPGATLEKRSNQKGMMMGKMMGMHHMSMPPMLGEIELTEQTSLLKYLMTLPKK